MSRLEIYLLGPPHFERDGKPLEIDTRKTIALIAYLAVTGEVHSREALVTLLWPESEPRQARAILRRNLSVLNKTLGGEGLAVARDTIGLDPEADIRVDVDHFQRLAQTGSNHDHPTSEVCPECLSDLAAAANVYRDDFLAGFTLRDSPNFDDWQSFETERLKRELAGALARLAHGHQARGELDPALTYAQRWLAVDPLHEPAHRQLMQLYADSGDRSAALRQYQSCVRLLKEELDAPPEDETVALYERIRAETKRHRKIIADSFAIVDGDTPQGMEKNLLGQGGMGHVYRGLNTQTEEPVAIKVLKPQIVHSNPDLVDRFIREGEALRQLNHPNIVKMLAASEQDGQHYLVMEYVAGGSLHDLIKQEGPLPVERVLDIALDLADALTRAHRLNIIHRDLKPPNVLLAEDGTPRLTDFGLARQMEGPRTTETGMIMGTVDYLSPEGCEGQALDERADIWAFGVILVEMLTGKRPFVGETLPSTLTAIITQPVPDLTAYRSDIPAPLIDLIGRMLEKKLDQRIPSVRLVGAELEAIIADRPITPTTPIAVPTGP
ncbi:MAG: protein kinase, partial [Anaerolineae bacterium]|nr:protein kinase [Anaerolineae bacterium]